MPYCNGVRSFWAGLPLCPTCPFTVSLRSEKSYEVTNWLFCLFLDEEEVATESEREKSDHEDDDEDGNEEPEERDEEPEERDKPESDQESQHEPKEKTRKAPPPAVLPKPKTRSKDLDDLPELVSSFDDRTVEEGSLVRMDCEVKSGSEVLVEWLVDNELISSEAFSHFTLINDGNLYSLLIAETRLEDSAVYTCCATNEAGTTKCTAELIVTGV